MRASPSNGVSLNGPDDAEHRYPGNVNLSFAYVEGESLLMGLKVWFVVGFSLLLKLLLFHVFGSFCVFLFLSDCCRDCCLSIFFGTHFCHCFCCKFVWHLH